MTTHDWSSLKKAADDATKPIPDGIYDIIVAKAEATRTSAGDKDMIKLVVEVSSGPYAGRQLFTQQVISPDSGFALTMFFNAMAALGIPDVAAVAPSGDVGSLAQALIGRASRADVDSREWQGVIRNNVKNFLPAAPGANGLPAAVPGAGGVPTPGAHVIGVPAAASAPPVPVAVTSAPTDVAPGTTPPPPKLPY